MSLFFTLAAIFLVLTIMFLLAVFSIIILGFFYTPRIEKYRAEGVLGASSLNGLLSASCGSIKAPLSLW